jgi:Tol biopolymer transport system component
MEENTMRFHPVEIQPGSSVFSVTPGSSVTVPFRLINRTGINDYFEISVRGIPSTWVVLEVPVIHLADGEQRETSLTVQPPVGMAGSTGVTRLAIRAASQANPDQGGEAIIELHINYDPGAATIGANPPGDPYMGDYPPGGSTFGTIQASSDGTDGAFFDSDLSPRRVDAGNTARLRIYNQQSTPQTYTLSWHNPQGNLEFVASQSGPIRVMPGEVVAVDFAVSPRSPNWFGGPVSMPYSVIVRSSEGAAQAHEGEVVSRALIPVWVLPAFLVFCLTAVCGVGFLWNWNQTRLTAATATAEAQQVGLLVEAAAATATAMFELTQIAALDPDQDPTNIWMTVTAVAEERLLATQTETPIPNATDTPTPEDTPVPTFTLTPTQEDTALVIIITPTVTETSVPTPTNTLIPSPTFTMTPPPTPTQIVLPVTGQGLFAFVSDRDGGSQLYIFDPEQNEIVPLTEGLGTILHPSWSPDGARIVFAAGEGENSDIYVMNSDGSEQINLTNSPSNDRFPAWSPDGSQIVFTTNRDGNDEIYRMDADGSNPINLTNSPSNDRQPAWYETGGLFGGESRILFTSDRDENSEIYAMNTDGSEPVNLTNHPSNDSAPAVRPDGGIVAFVSDRDGNFEIYRMDLNGENQENVSGNPANDIQPAWSPEEDWIAFVSDRDGSADIFVLELGQEEPVNITQSPAQDLYPTWR